MGSSNASTYSPEWFATFLRTVPPEQTLREVEFIAGHLQPGSRILDVPCGVGRHARLLAGQGHRVVAVDREHALLGSGGKLDIFWVCGDMRFLPLRAHQFDAILCLWQSFGYFAADLNAAILRDWSTLVKPGGLLFLDLYHRTFFESHQGERDLQRGDSRIRERSHMSGDRLVVELTYGGPEPGDRMEWQLFTPESLTQFAHESGWEVLDACRDFRRDLPPDPERARVQYVLRARAT